LAAAEEDPLIDVDLREVPLVGVDGERPDPGDPEPDQVVDRFASGPAEADDGERLRGVR
jgi:hypothetical protein